MTGATNMAESLPFCDTWIRVRYAETDRMGYLHHAMYPVYFEQGRTELLRQQGVSYRQMEDEGFFLAVVKLEVRFRRPAFFDDLLRLRTTLTRVTAVRVEHRYELFRDQELLCEGATTLACVDGEGKLQALPSLLRRS